MPLFVARHQHSADRCPAGDPNTGAMLLTHLNRKNAAAAGVTIHADAVIDNAHTFYVILDADSRGRVEEFMAPFAQAGSVEIMSASHCEAVVERGGCATVPVA